MVTTNASYNNAEVKQRDEGVSASRKSFVASPMYSSITAHDPSTGTSLDFNTRSEHGVNVTSEYTPFPGTSINASDTSSLDAARGPLGSRETDKNESRYSRHIPVINTPGKHGGSFKGVLRRKVKNYFLNGIDPDSNEGGYSRLSK